MASGGATARTRSSSASFAGSERFPNEEDYFSAPEEFSHANSRSIVPNTDLKTKVEDFTPIGFWVF